jgi:hypothetical protein
MTRAEALRIRGAEVLTNGECVGHLANENGGTVLVMDWHKPGCEHHGHVLVVDIDIDGKRTTHRSYEQADHALAVRAARLDRQGIRYELNGSSLRYVDTHPACPEIGDELVTLTYTPIYEVLPDGRGVDMVGVTIWTPPGTWECMNCGALRGADSIGCGDELGAVCS